VVDDVERDEVDFVCRSFGIRPVSDVDLLSEEKMVSVEIEDVMDNGSRIFTMRRVGEKISDSDTKTCSIVLRGSDNLILDEAERSLHDALCVVRCLVEEPFIVPGGGSVEIGICNKLVESSLIERDGYIFYEMSKAFEGIPYFLARNAGLYPVDILSELKRDITNDSSMGISVRKSGVGNMIEEEVVQPLKVSMGVVTLALETVSMILRIDDILPAIR
jgi:T-complex protein 1 subunit delta